jgi:hypothetical protein
MKTMRERPLQIYLRPDQDTALRRMAKAENVSIAELVRRGVDKLMANAPIEEDPALGIMALGGSGPSDLAERHDYYIVQAIMNESRPAPRRSKSNGKRSLRGRKRLDRSRKR